MKKTVLKLKGIHQTGKAMKALILGYHSDVAFLDGESLESCFYTIAKLPYIADPENDEAIQRPKATFSSDAEFRDCDDKCIALGACLYRRGIPFEIWAVSESPLEDIHHVVLKADLGKYGVHFLDCTYPENEFLNHKPFYKLERI